MANSYLTHTQTADSSNTKFTFSFWMKRSSISASQCIYATQSGSDEARIEINSSDELFLYKYNGSFQWKLQTNRKFRDISAWYHIVLKYDSTQSTSSDRLKLYVNGVEETSFASSTYPGSSENSNFFQGAVAYIGCSENTAAFFDGYLSHVAMTHGYAYAPTTFGETDSTSGIWKFKSPSGVTWGTQGYHLKFENSGALGTDSSGQSNTFAVNGNLKQALDTPSNVHATWNKLDGGTTYFTLTDGNTTAQSNASVYTYGIATLGVSSGKFYWEVEYDSNNESNRFPMIGISSTQSTDTTYELGHYANDWCYYANGSTGKLRNNNSDTNWGTGYVEGDIIGVALDCTNNKLYFSKNGVWQESGDPSAGNNGISITAPSSTPLGFYFPAICYFDGTYRGTFKANFGNGYFGTTAITSAGSNGNGSLFEYDVPSGYYALNTKNINTYG